MKKSQGKAKKYIKNYVSQIVFPAAADIKKDYLKQNFIVECHNKRTTVSVEIIDKRIVRYDDSKLKKTFKNLAPLAESILDCMLANYIGYDELQDV